MDKIKLVRLPPNDPVMGKISVGDLIDKCNVAMNRMSNRNPNKLLIYNCALVIKQLADQLSAHRIKEGVQ